VALPETLKANRLENLLNILPAGVVVINGNGIVIQSNPQAKVLLGEPLDGQSWRKVIARAFKPRADDGHEVSLTNGKRVKLAISPLEGEPGQLILLTDLTETRQLQSRISHMQRLSSLGNMVASLAHQIRTPLSAAMLYAANLVQPKIDDTTRIKFSQRVNDRLKELESQVNDMLLFAKSGENQVLSSISVSEWMDSVLPTAHILANKHQVKLDVQAAISPAYVSGNLTALQGALLNLIDNAIQASQANDTVWVRASWQQQSIQIEVIDQGAGIPFPDMKQIFSPFFTTKTNGTGLGLAVVKSVMQSHGGDVKLKHDTRKGAHFTLTLPAQSGLSKASGE
jgi:two-component system sensor histidine kinase FlrB